MPGGKKQTCKYYLKDFIEPSVYFTSHQKLKGEMSQDIYPCFNVVFLKSSCYFFSSVSYIQCFNINVTTLCQWFYKLSVQNGTITASIVW